MKSRGAIFDCIDHIAEWFLSLGRWPDVCVAAFQLCGFRKRKPSFKMKQASVSWVIQPFDMFVVAGIELDYSGGKQHFAHPFWRRMLPSDSHQKLRESSDATMKLPDDGSYVNQKEHQKELILPGCELSARPRPRSNSSAFKSSSTTQPAAYVHFR
jgi:hypothetical protein